MKDDINFPNPVPRSDLPVRRRRKVPRLLAGALVLGLLGLVFLPQLLGTRVGRRVVRMYLESKFNGEAAVGEFNTHWFGGTTAVQCWVFEPGGRKIGFNTLQTEAGLLKLLRGHFDLGQTQVDGLWVDQVLDYGDGTSTFSRIMGVPTPRPGAVAPPAPPAALPRVSGKITLTHAFLVLGRGTIEPRTLTKGINYFKVWDVNGTLDVAALDRPWSYNLRGEVVPDAPEPPAARGAALKSSGTICLGEGGKMIPAAMKFDLAAEVQDLAPSVVGPVFWPSWKAADFTQAFGANMDSLKVSVTTAGGKVVFTPTEMTGGTVELRLRPVIDLTTVPPMFVTADADAPNPPGNQTVTTRVSEGLARQGLVYLNPFFRDAEGGAGTATLKVEALWVPLDRPRLFAMRGQLEAHGVRLAKPAVDANGAPRNLVAGLAALSGGIDGPPLLDMPPAKFLIENGLVKISPYSVTIGDTSLIVAGSSTTEGKGAINMTATLAAAPKLFAELPELATAAGRTGSATASVGEGPLPGGPPPAGLAVALTGPADAPRLDTAAAARSLPPALGRAFTEALLRHAGEVRVRQIEDASVDKVRVETLHHLTPATKP